MNPHCFNGGLNCRVSFKGRGPRLDRAKVTMWKARGALGLASHLGIPCQKGGDSRGHLIAVGSNRLWLKTAVPK